MILIKIKQSEVKRRMAENNQLSNETKNDSTDTSSTDVSSAVIGNHENAIVPHKISNHNRLVQTMVMVDGEWINVNDTNDQKNMKKDVHTVNKKVVEAQKGIVEAKNAADSAVKQADSAISASKVNSDAIKAQDTAISEAKSAIDSANAEIQRTASNAASNAAQIRADVAQIQKEIDTSQSANSASVEKLRSDISSTQKNLDTVRDNLTKAQSAVEQNKKLINDSVADINDKITQDRADIATAQQANADTAKKLDGYTQQAVEQGKTIETIQEKQDGFSATIADIKGNVSKVSDTVDGLTAGLKDAQGNIASVKAQADQLNIALTDHSKNITQLTATTEKLSSTLEDASGRLSKVEQTASEHSTTLSDLQDNLTKVKQTADGLVTTVKDVQGNITQIKQDAKGTLEQINDIQGDITTLQTDVTGVKTTITGHDKSIHTLQADSKTLKDDMTDAKGNISSLQKTATSLTSTMQDHSGRLSKVEQTAGTLTSEFSNHDGRLSKVEQTADGTKQTVADQQGQINTIKADATGIHQTLTGQGNQIATINVALNGLNSKYEGMNGGGINLLHNSKGPFQPANGGRIDNYSVYYDSTVELVKGQQYTISGQTNGVFSSHHVPGTESDNCVLWFVDNNGVNRIVSDEKTSTGTTFVWDDPTGQYSLRVNTYHPASTNKIRAWEIKVERGNTATPYSPNPNDVDAKIMANSTQITQNQQVIALKADQATVNSLSGEVRQNTAQLKIQADQINSKVSSEDFKTLDNKVNGMKIGGRNYILNSAKKVFVPTGQDNRDLLWNVSKEALNNNPDKNGQYKTHFSFDMQASSALPTARTWKIYWRAPPWTSLGTITYPANTTDVQHYELKITTPVTQPIADQIFIRFMKEDTGNPSYTVTNSLLTIGDVFEDYSPNPDDIIASVQSNTTAIDQNSKQISLKADQTEVDNVKNTASSNSSRLDIMNNEIQSKVTSTDVNNIVDSKGYATTSSVQSMITQSAGSINETITNLTSKVNSNNGGGVNLVSGTIEDIVLDDTANTGTQGWHFGIFPLNTELKVGDKITVSADVTLTGKGNLSQWGMSLWSKDVVDMRSNEYSADVKKGSTATLTVTSIADTSKPTALLIYCGRIGDTEGKKAVFHHLKVERGEIATPWSPAPSDNATVTQVQQVTASVDGLKSTVANKADTSQVTQLSNLVQSKVSSSDFNSKVTQLANDINLRVTKGDLLSQINIAAGHTLIQSNKIYFDADSFVMSPNSKAFIPSAYITNINADKITTGTLDAAKFNVKNFSADNITGGTLDGIKFKTELMNDNRISIMGDKIAWTSNTSFGEQLNGWIGNSVSETDWLSLRDLRFQSIGNVGVDTKNTDDITRWSLADYNQYDQPGLMVSNTHKFIPDESKYDETASADQSNAVLLASANTYVAVRRGTGILAHLDSKNFVKDSVFAIQKDDRVGFYVGGGDNGDEVKIAGNGAIRLQGNRYIDDGFNDAVTHTLGNLQVDNLHVKKWLGVDSNKNAIVKTSQGTVAINAYETAEYYFGDIGEGQTGADGIAYIGIEKLFNETVNTDIPYQVFITAYGPGNVWVEQREHDRFIVKSDQPNIKFGWEIKAKRKGYEHTRLQNVDNKLNHMEATS